MDFRTHNMEYYCYEHTQHNWNKEQWSVGPFEFQN